MEWEVCNIFLAITIDFSIALLRHILTLDWKGYSPPTGKDYTYTCTVLNGAATIKSSNGYFFVKIIFKFKVICSRTHRLWGLCMETSRKSGFYRFKIFIDFIFNFLCECKRLDCVNHWFSFHFEERKLLDFVVH